MLRAPARAAIVDRAPRPSALHGGSCWISSSPRTKRFGTGGFRARASACGVCAAGALLTCATSRRAAVHRIHTRGRAFCTASRPGTPRRRATRPTRAPDENTRTLLPMPDRWTVCSARASKSPPAVNAPPAPAFTGARAAASVRAAKQSVQTTERRSRSGPSAATVSQIASSFANTSQASRLVAPTITANAALERVHPLALPQLVGERDQQSLERCRRTVPRRVRHAEPRDRRRHTVREQQRLAGRLVPTTGLAHLLRVHDLACIVKRRSDKHRLRIERRGELDTQALAQQRGSLEHELVMAHEPR